MHLVVVDGGGEPRESSPKRSRAGAASGAPGRNRAAWRDYCHHMAEANYALAEACEELDMIRAYVDLAARWVNLAERPPD